MSNNILLIPKGFFGDLLLMSPVISALRRGSPATRISVVCSPATAEFVRRDPAVNNVIVYDRRSEHGGVKGMKRFAALLREQAFDIAFSFHRSPRTALALWLAGVKERVGFADSYLSYLYTRRVHKERGCHDVMRNLKLVAPYLEPSTQDDIRRLEEGASCDVSWAKLCVPEVGRDKVSQRVQEILSSGSRYVVLSPSSAWETKRWDSSRFREVASVVASRGIRVVVVGARSDVDVCAAVSDGIDGVSNLCGETSLEDLIALIRGASAVVCNDSLALHICSATQTPVVAIFCATSPLFGFGPWMNEAVVLEKGDLFCKPCHRHGSRRCPTGTRLCMTGVSASEAVCAVDVFLRKKEATPSTPHLRVIES